MRLFAEYMAHYGHTNGVSFASDLKDNLYEFFHVFNNLLHYDFIGDRELAEDTTSLIMQYARERNLFPFARAPRLIRLVHHYFARARSRIRQQDFANYVMA